MFVLLKPLEDRVIVKAVEAEETQPAVKSYKRVENGKLVIIKADKKYNSVGQQL